ncbi:hypothetical protein GCM10027275_54010 [Rhabdobacter roseus]|uniref:Uncharacterized protein n=1 Tax=Rhabdobacter roseus TaxID=1655419 RepID=A0A840U6B8_9BACT|nr:hypothetical protein [Rhabdobacter roseus]MBB5287369.1 hypothetical protein [Rhabdobacter roseus]
MTISFKHIGLIIGIASIFLSFLFAGRQQGTYQILLLGGIATAFFFYLTILFARNKLKSKLFWSALVVACAVLQWLTEPILIDTSYRYYISQNQNTLNEINDILQRKQGEVFMLNDSVTVKYDTLTFHEKEKLKRGRKDLGVYLISKSNKGIYYGLWGFLDVRLGITYLQTLEHTGDKYRHLTGSWFR